MDMMDTDLNTSRLLRYGLNLEYSTLAWNVIGTVVVTFAALRSHSIALAGFGLDSLIEIGASIIVVWELTGTGENRQKLALRMIGVSFIAVASYILIQSTRALYLHVQPGTSPLGIAWLIVTCVAMVVLALGKGRIGRMLKNPVLLVESRVTMVDAYLAGSVLLGLILNAALAWWWADALAGLVIVVYGFIEGRHAWMEGAPSRSSL